MKVSFFAIASAMLLGQAKAVEFSVGSCADMAAVDDTTATSLMITSSSIECEEYTRFRVRNSLVLKASSSEVSFSNVSFKVLGELTVEPDVIFTGVVDQVKNGGVIHVSDGATATFMGTSTFTENSVFLKYTGPVSCGPNCFSTGRGINYVTKKGGAIHNKGTMIFEGDATFTGNRVNTDDNTDVGRGGAISNNAPASMVFKSKLTMADNRADGFFEGQGGGIYNRGDITVEGESYFTLNVSSDGGGIYNEDYANIVFNGMATFFENSVFDLTGGAIANYGGDVTFNAGSLFDNNGASGSGDGGLGGAIYNTDGGVVTLTGSTTFNDNGAFIGGAIFNNDSEEAPITTYPEDTVFTDNSAEICPNVFSGDEDNCEA